MHLNIEMSGGVFFVLQMIILWIITRSPILMIAAIVLSALLLFVIISEIRESKQKKISAEDYFG